MTTQKKLILEILQNSDGHMTADEIYLKAKKVLPKIAVGTIYRNLKILVDEKMLNRIAVANEPDIFDKTPTVHPHKICVKCHKVFDLPVEVIDFNKLKGNGDEILSANLNVECICLDCLNKNK